MHQCQQAGLRGLDVELGELAGIEAVALPVALAQQVDTVVLRVQAVEAQCFQLLQQLFERHQDFEVVSCCSDGNHAVEAVRTERPDVLVLDLRMPGTSGLDVLKTLAAENSRCRTVLLTAAVRDEEAVHAVRLGAKGIVLKDSQPDTLLDCVRRVHRGEQWIDRDTMDRALGSAMRQPPAVPAALPSSRSPQAVLFLTVFIDLMGFGIVIPLLPIYAERLDATPFMAGGLIAWLAAVRLSSVLYGVRASDPAAWAAALAVLIAAATLAHIVPARRALRVDPAVTLKQ